MKPERIDHLQLARKIEAKRQELINRGIRPTHQKVAIELGTHQPTVGSHLLLLTLPQTILDLMDKSKHNGSTFPFAAAQRLLQMPQEQRNTLIDDIVSQRITQAAAIETLTSFGKEQAKIVKKPRVRKTAPPAQSRVPEPKNVTTTVSRKGQEVLGIVKSMREKSKIFDSLSHINLAEHLRLASPVELNELNEELKQLIASVAHVKVAVETAYHLSFESGLQNLEFERDGKKF